MTEKIDKRKFNGRPKLEEGEKKVHLTPYVQKKKVDALGGRKECSKICVEAIEKEYKKTLKNKTI